MERQLFFFGDDEGGEIENGQVRCGVIESADDGAKSPVEMEEMPTYWWYYLGRFVHTRAKLWSSEMETWLEAG